MSAEDCEKVELPAWGQDLQPAINSAPLASEKSLHIASLLLAKLGDFLVPGDQTTVTLRQMSEEAFPANQNLPGTNGEKDKLEDSNVLDGRLSVFVHKREDQSSHEVIQPLLRLVVEALTLADVYVCLQ
jgi:E3 ubiquitin-protein ligase HECTD4